MHNVKNVVKPGKYSETCVSIQKREGTISWCCQFTEAEIISTRHVHVRKLWVNMKTKTMYI
jgi:hypothetical protein